MKKLLLPLALTGLVVACSDAGGVDPDAIPVAQKHALWMALDSAFRHDTTLDPAFTGDSGLYVLMSTVVIPFVDRDRKSTRLNSSHLVISYAVFCLKKKKQRSRVPRNRGQDTREPSLPPR